MKKQFIDTELDCSLKKLDSHFMWKEKQKQELKKQIFTNIEKVEYKGRNKTDIPMNNKNVNLVRRFTYASTALTLLFSLFFGSAFISPVMAEVVSKIPYLGQIFESKNDLVSTISDELKSKGYNVIGVGMAVPEKEINIQIKNSENDFDSVKTEIEGFVKNILQSRNYNSYTISVSEYKEDKNEEEFDKEFEIIHTAATEKFKSQNYNVLRLSMRYDPKTIELEIPNTETRIDEIKQIVEDTFKENNINSIPLNVTIIDIEELEQEEQWRQILDIVEEDLLGKKDYKVRMVGYNIHPEPEIQVFINLPSIDENAKDFAQQLEKVINDFLQSKQMQSKVKNDSYHITIFSKDNKKINK